MGTWVMITAIWYYTKNVYTQVDERPEVSTPPSPLAVGWDPYPVTRGPIGVSRKRTSVHVVVPRFSGVRRGPRRMARTGTISPFQAGTLNVG